MAVAAAVVTFWALAMTALVVGGVRDRRRRRRRDEVARQAAFRRILFARLATGAPARPAERPAHPADGWWRSWDDGLQVRILPAVPASGQPVRLPEQRRNRTAGRVPPG